MPQQGLDFLAVQVFHGQDAFQNRAMLYQAARSFAAFLVPLVFRQDLDAVLILSGFALCLRQVCAEFG